MRRIAIAVCVAGLGIAAVSFLGTSTGAAKAPGSNGPIVFGQFDPASTSGDTLLYTANPDGTGQKQLLPTHTCCASWSPDGSRLTVAAQAGDGRCCTYAIVNSDGSGYRVVPFADPTVLVGCSVWSPDGVHCAGEAADDPANPARNGFYTLNAADGTIVRRVTATPAGLHDIPADYSPDGSRIVFWRGDESGQNAALDVVSSDGSGLEEVESSPTPDCCSASWSPDGRRILFTSIGVPETVRPDGSGLQPLTLKARCASRSGRAVLAGISVYGLRCHKGRFFLDPNREYWVVHDPVWSPDGKKIAFDLFVWTSKAAGVQGVYTANANGSGVRALTQPTPAAARTLDFPGSIDWGPAPA